MNDYALTATGISVMFGGFTAVNNVDINVRRGAIHAILGPNGAGKTTLFNALSGLVPLARGSISLNGIRIDKLPVSRRVHHGLSRSFQISNLFFDLTVKENVRLALQALLGYRAFSFWSRTTRQTEILLKVDSILHDLALSEKSESLAAELSHGEQRRLEIGLALASKPTILFLDEPTAGMGMGDIEFTKKLVLKHVAEDKTTLVLIEHNMSLVMDISDTITVLQQGTKIAEGTADEVRANPIVRTAYLGE